MRDYKRRSFTALPAGTGVHGNGLSVAGVLFTG
jgi:hypothetical protein